MDELTITQSDSRPLLRQAENDEHLISLWLHGRSPHTQRAYGSDIEAFRALVDKPLRSVILDDIHRFIDQIIGSVGTKSRRITSVKSLYSFGHKLGYFQFNVAAAISLPKQRNRLSERILTEEQVQDMIEQEPVFRNRVLLKTLYVSGMRVSELANLCWCHLTPRKNGEGQISVFGKGGKTRVILLPAGLWAELFALRAEDIEYGLDVIDVDPVFRSNSERGGLGLCPERITKIVKAAADRAGVPKNVSSHWLRHAHASHSLDHGAPTHLVQATLGHASLATTSRYAHARPNESSSTYLKS